MLEKRRTVGLVKAAAAGEKEAFTSLIDLHRQYMYATAMTVCRNEDDALDAIQDTVLTLWEKLATLRDPAAYKTWMTRVLLNHCYQLLRSRRRTTVMDDLALLEEGYSEERDTGLDVQNAMARLSEEDRLILQLFYYEDMSIREIAQVLEIKPDAVKMRLSRSRKRFKQVYEGRVHS